MIKVLNAIQDFYEQLEDRPTEEQARGWWQNIDLIEASISGDSKYDKFEKSLVVNLKRALNEVIRATTEQLIPDVSNLRQALSALRSSIERRTIGANGYPLRN